MNFVSSIGHSISHTPARSCNIIHEDGIRPIRLALSGGVKISAERQKYILNSSVLKTLRKRSVICYHRVYFVNGETQEARLFSLCFVTYD